MMNIRLIEDTLKIVVDYFTAEHIYENNASIRKRAEDWYCHTEITDAETLAALVMYGRYNPEFSYEDICEIKKYFFPTEPYEFSQSYFSIAEIEDAIDDEMWR